MTMKELISLIESMGIVKSTAVFDCWTFPDRKNDYFIAIEDNALRIFSNNIDIDFEEDDMSDADYNIFKYKDKNPLTKELIKMGLQILIDNFKAVKKKFRIDKIEEL